LSGNSAQIGVDAQKAYETAAEIINNDYDFDLPLAKGQGLPGLGGAKVRLIFCRPSIRSAKGPRRGRAPDHPGKRLRHRRHLPKRGRRHRQPDLRALPDSVSLRRKFLAQFAQTRLEIFLPPLAA